MSTDPSRPEPPVLPAQTSDDQDAGWGDRPASGSWSQAESDDERYLRERPPHWD